MKNISTRKRSLATLARIARRRLVVRVRPLALAAAVALGAHGPSVFAQTVITPLQGAGQTATVVRTQGNQTTVSTQSLRDGNAFSTYSNFQVGQGDVVKLAVPQGANWWVNIVRDQRVRVDGRLESRLVDGSIGGNILFVDSHGFAVGPSGQVDVGRLTFAAPSTSFVDGLLAGGGLMSGAAVGGLLAGQFERSATGGVDVQGRVSARDGVSLMAGLGAGAERAVSITGQVVVQGRVAGSAVNLGDLKSLTPLQDSDGVIDITTPGSITLDGVLISDSSHWRQAGAVRVLAGQDIAVGASAQVSASGAAGSSAAGGQVVLFAQRDIANTPGATLRARGDGAGAGGAIEYSGLRKLHLSGMRFDAGSDTGAAGLVFVDPDDAVVQGINLTGGGHFVYGGDDTMTVKNGAVINTRQVASGQDATNASVVSTGHSGNIVLKAPRITVEAGALLDASVLNAAGSTFAAGDITLTAKNSANWITLLGFANADASIDVAGTLKGADVTLQASIESSAVYDGVSAALTEKGLSLLAESLGSPLALSLAYTEAIGNATVNVRETAVLAASKDLSITALADRSAGAELQVEGSSAANLSAGFTRIAGTTSVDIASGATLSAADDISLVAASKTTIGMTSAAAGETDEKTGAANVASVVFAGSMSDVTTRVNVAAGAVLTSGGSTEVQAFHSGSYETSAEVTVYGGGTAGVVGALSLQQSVTSAAVDGTVNAGGDVRVMAMNVSVKNSISGTSEVAQKAPEDPPLDLPQSLELSNDDAKQKLQLGFLAMAEKLSAEADVASGGGASETKPSVLKLAGAMTWSESDHTTRATVGAGARVTAGGDAVVDAQALVGQTQSVATSEATSETDSGGSKVALAVAFNYADHNATTLAQLGVGAEINAGHVAVNAATDIPEFYTNGLPLDWSSFSAAYANLMGGTDFLLDGFNTRVGASSSAANLAVAGALNLTFMTHDTRAWVDTDAKITTTVNDGTAWSYDVKEVGFDSDLVEMLIPLNTYTLDKDLGVLGNFVSTNRTAPKGPALDEINFTRSFTGSTVVRATNNVQTLHHAGGDAPEAGGRGGAVGGTFSMVSRSNTAMAGIADRAEINTQRLDVTASTSDWLVSISPTSGAGAGVSANGIASYNQLSETTVASISREALVTAPSVNVDAQLALGVIAITGAVSRSENSGVGIGLAMNEVTGDTRAYVGDNDTDGGGADTLEGNAGFIATGALRVQAKTDGMVVASGVAGATAGEKPPPGSKSSGENLADKTATDSAGAQTQLDGSDASMAPLAESSAPAKGSGSDQAAAGSPAASKPPSFSIAGAGAIVTNFSDLDTTALVDGAVVHAIGSGTSTVAVQALSDLTQVSVAGGGALSLSKNPGTKFTAAIAGAVAIQDSDDDTTARIVGSTISDLADQSGSLVIQALKSGERTAVATGISANLSKGSTTSLSLVGAASVTTTTDDTVAEMVNSTVSGDAASPSALGVQVVAYDRSRIGAGGGALSVSTGKGSAGVGAAISIVNANGSTQAQVSGGSVTQAHDLAVLALSSQKVVGVGAVAGLQSSSDSTSLGQLMGSFVYNHIGTHISAGIKGSALVNLTGDLTVQAGGAPTSASLDALLGAARASDVIDYEMTSASNGYTDEFKNAVGGESIVGVAGTLSVTLGSKASSLGLSYVHNDIQTTYGAELNGRITAGGGVSVAAISQANIVGVSAGVGATKGKFSGMGSASVNLMGQRTQAVVSGGTVNAAGLSVQSDTRGNTFALAGNLSFAVGSGNGSAAGAAVAYTQTGTKTYSAGGDTLSTRAAGNTAAIHGATVNVGAGTVQVQASNTSDLMSVAASGAAADGNVGFAGTVTVNEIADVTEARVFGVVTAGTLLVQAGEGAGATSARIRSLAGGVSASKGYSGALALGFNTINSTRSAQIMSTTVTAGSAVSVLADAGARIETLSVTAAGGKDYALAGSSSANVLNGSTLARVADSHLTGTATALSVHASQSGAIESLAGAVSAGGTGAIGGAVAVNLMGQGSGDFKVSALLTRARLTAPVAVSLNADLTGSIQSVAASGSGAGTAAINGSVTTNAIKANVLAEVNGGSPGGSGGAFTVQAGNQAAISSLAGTISGAGTAAVGAAVSVNEIGGSVTARVKDYAMRATGAVDVGATSSGTIRSVAAGVSGAGTSALAGSNTTNAITSTVLAQMDNVTQAVASASLRVQALDSSTIQSFAGSVAGGGNAAGGAAFALNFLGRTALDAASSKLVKAEVLNSNILSGGAVQVKALSTSRIESMGLAVGGSGNVAVTGSNTTNLLEDQIVASWSGGSLNGAATSLTVQADDAATVRTLAGNVSGSGAGAFGAAIAVNEVGSVVRASLSGATLGAAVTTVVDAHLRGEIRSVAASGAAAGGTAVNGSFTTNAIGAQVSAEVQGLNQATAGGAFTVSADNAANIFSLAGTISGSGSAAAGAAVSVNDISGGVSARLANSTLRATGAVNVQATTSGTIQSVAAGMAGGGSVGLAGSNTTNGITSTVLAQLDGVNMVAQAATLNVLARDTAAIQSFAGAVAGGGAAGGGAALALNFLGRTATDAARSKVVKAEVLDSVVRSTGAVQVKAHSTSTIESIGVAAGVSGTAAISGSNATNLLEDEITASWLGSELIFSNTPTNTLTVSALQAAKIDSLAGNLSGSGGVAVGAALAVNRIGTQTQASLVGVTNANHNSGIGHWSAVASNLLLSAESDNQINTLAVGMSAGAAGVQGSVAVSMIDAQTHATLGADGYVTNVVAAGSVAVTANSRDRIRALAGAVGLGATGVGAAGGVLTNVISSSTTAGITGSATYVEALGNGTGLTVRDASLASAPDLMNITQLSDAVLAGASFNTRTIQGLAVQATSIQQIGALTAVAGGGALGAAGAAINVDQIGGSTRAYIDSAVFVSDMANAHAAQSVDVMAANHAMVASSATALAIGAVGVSGAMGTEIIDRSTRAEVIGGAVVNAKGAVSVKAVSTNAVAQISAGAAGGALFGVAGSGDLVLLKGSTVALVDKATVNAESIAVVADGRNASNLVAGAVSYAGAPGGVGVGLSFTVNVSGSTVRALVDDSTLRADGAVVIDADNRTESFSVSSSAAAGGSYAAAVGASVSVMEGATEAAVTGSSSVGKRTLATGLLASSNDAPVTINLASAYDAVGTATQTDVRFSLNGLAGRVAPADAVVTVTDGVTTVAAVRQPDGSYAANVAGLDDGVLMAQVVLSEGGVQKVSTTTLLKSTGKSDADAALVAASLPAAQTRIATLSSFEEVDARNHAAVQFVLKSDAGLTADGAAVVTVSDGTRQVAATRNADGSYTADVRSLGDGVLTALVRTPAGGSATTRLMFVKSSGAASLSVTANETIALNHNAGQVGVGGVAGVGASANVVVGKSTVDATVNAGSIRVSGAATVSAERDADIDMVTATGGGGGLAGVSGAVGVLVFGAAPDSNANSELNGGGGTLSQIGTATQSNRTQAAGGGLSATESASLNSSASYDTQGAYAGASGQHRTSATVGAQSLVAGSLSVKSLDRTMADNSAGAVALGGAAGVSAGVAVTQLGGANHAGVSVGSMAIAGDVSVASGTRSTRSGASVKSLAVAGAGGFVGVGAAVSVASNSTANTAVLAGNLQAGGSVAVLALDESSMSSEAYGATAGALSVGVVTATATQSGSVGTSQSGTHSGQGLTAVAERNASVNAFAKGGSAGVVAGSGAGATATDSGTVSLNLGSGTVLDAGSGALSLAARSNPGAHTQALGVAVGAGAAVGVSVALSTVSTAVDVNAAGPVTLRGAGVSVAAVLGAGASTVSSQATAGAGALLLGATGAGATSTNRGQARVNLGAGVTLGTTGDVTLSATDSMAVDASALGVGAGFVGVGVAVSKAVSNSTVGASATGVRGSVGGSLQVSASGNESIDSNAAAGSGGVVAGAGADASVDHDQSVSADLGVAAGQTLVVGGRTTIEASRTVRYDSRTTAVSAAAMGASGAVTRATLDGSATARLLDGASLDAASLRVLATNDLARTDLSAQSAVGGGGGVVSGAGAGVFTRLSGDATASIGHSATVLLEDLLEVRAYNEMHGSSRAQMDVGGAVPIALVNTEIQGTANADAVIGNNTHINVYGESAVNALSYINLEANSVSKTYGLAAAAQGNAKATANVNNRVAVGTGSELRSTKDMTLLAGQDLDFNRNKHFVTARVDLFNHSAIPVSINPDADATLNLNNALVVNANAIRSGGTIKLGGVEGTYVVEGKGKVSDWTRDLGELVGLSSDYGSSKKNLNSTSVLKGDVEAGFGNKQRLVVGVNGTIVESEGDVRYTITNEDLSASASAYVERLYDQLARYGDVPEVRAFVEAELSFYFATLLREGLAEEMTMANGTKVIVASSGVAANFLNIKDLRAGSGNIELFGNDVSGTAKLVARADSEIYIENRSPLNLRVFNMEVDANGGFAKYNGSYLMSAADIGSLNKTTKTTGLSVDSIDTRGGGSAQQLPKLTVKNTYMPTGTQSATELRVTASDGTWADLREDQVRAPELRVNGWLYNKLGTVNLNNTAGSISVYAENPAYVPRLDGKEITVSAGKNFVLSSPTISQSVGGSPESLYAVHYSDDQQRILNNLGIAACGSARPGGDAATYNPNCLVNGAGGVYATGAIFIGARYLNINGTVQSGQADYNLVLSHATVGTQITNWRSTWLAKRGTFLAQGRSSLIQLSGPLPTDSEAEINKQYANGKISATARVTALAAMATRRLQPIVYYDAEANVLKVAPTYVQGGLVELVGSIINTGGGVVRALDGYARINIDNQTAYGLDLQGLDTGGDAGMIRITDLSKPIKNADGSIRAYAVTTYQRDTDGKFKAKVTEGTGVGAALISTSGSLLANPVASVKARFNYSPLANSTYSWSAGYEFMTEKRYYLKTSSWLGFIPGDNTKWDSEDTYVKTANAMVEDVYVGTKVPVGGGNFSLTTKRVTTDAEKEIYYRSWRKCGFLCIKKTYYVDRRTEVGLKDIFTQRVAADHDIKIELVGYDTGVLNVKSVGAIRLGGNISNASGTVSLQSVNGAIRQLNTGAVVEGVNLSFLAKTGIGTGAAPINVITGTGSFTAESQSGPVAFRSTSGALRINKVSTTGNVWLDGDDSIVGLAPGAVHVKGNRLYLSAPRGSIGEFNADGSVKSTLNIDSGDSTNGGLSAYSRSGVAIKEMTGNLWVDQVATGGDVYLEAPGDLIDNNRNETRDERTEAELLSLWDQAALQGTDAQASRQLTLSTTRAQYRRYWSLRDVRGVVTDANGSVTSYQADPIGTDYRYRFDAELRQQFLDNGVGESQIAAMEAAQTAEVLALHAEYGTTLYQTGNDQVIAAVNTANAVRGKAEVGALAEWTDAELKSPLPKAVFSKSSTDTQTRIEEPNVVGNRVVLRPGGQIGRDDGQVVIPLLSADRTRRGLAPELTADERLAIMSAESDDMSLDKQTWTLTVVKKDTFNVLSNRLNVDSKGFVYLGADTTASYPNGGTANLEMVKGTGEIRIKVSDSILSVAAAGVSVIQGQKAILEAANGSIGSAAKPVQMLLTNNSTGTLTARAQEGLWIHSIGDMRPADVFTPGSANLSATGAIIDARPVVNFPKDGDRTVRSIEAKEINLNALGGSVGSSANPMVLKVGSDGVNATSALGYSLYLQPSEGADLVLRSVNAGLDVNILSPYGHLTNLSAVTARRSIFAEVKGDITGLMYTAGTDVVLAAGGDMSGSKVAAGSGNASLTAGGSVTLTSLTSNRDAAISAGGAISLTSGSAGRDLNLASQQGGIQGVAWRAGNSLLATAHGAQGDIRATTVSASVGGIKLVSGGDLSVTLASALGAVDMTAARGMSLLNATSSGAGLTLTAGGALSLLAGRARTDVTLSAGAGLRASSLTSSVAQVLATATTGELNAQTVTAAQGATFSATGGDLRLGTVKTTAGALALTAGGSLAVYSATAPGAIVVRAGDDAELRTVLSSTASVDLASAKGALRATSVTAKTTFKADALLGALTVGSFSAASADLDAGTALTVTGTGKTTGAMALDSDGAMSLATLTASAGAVTANAGGALSVKSATAANALVLAAGGGLTAAKLVSTKANIALASVAGLLRATSVTAKTLFQADAGSGDLMLGSFSAASVDLDAGSALAVTGTGKTTGAMALDSGGSMALGTLVSSAGAITAQAGGAMTAKTIQASGALNLEADTGLTAAKLTSTTSDVKVASDAGSVTVASATGKTSFEATSGGDLRVTSFTVSLGGALLKAGGTTNLSKGSARYDITVTSDGNAALGTLTSGSTITASSTGGGLTFGTLKAATGITMDAARAWSSGNAISGKALTVTRGTVDVLARTGNLTVGTLNVGTLASTPQSKLKTLAGSLKLGKVVGLKATQLDVQVAGGTKTLPRGY